MKIKKIIELWKCNKCGHEWESKKNPRMCPKCKTVRWNDKVKKD